MSIDPLKAVSLYERLRTRFDARRRPRVTATFDELLAMFRDPKLTWGDIARKFGVTRANVKGLYYRNFAVITGKSGLDLKRARTRQRHEELEREMPQDPILGPVARAAEEAGLTVRHVPNVDHSFGLRHRALIIEGHLCSVRRPQRAQGKHRWKYVPVRFRRSDLERYSAYIVHINVSGAPERILVIPIYAAKRVLMNKDQAHAWVPLKRRPTYHGNYAKVDWLKYENAWQLLEGE